MHIREEAQALIERGKIYTDEAGGLHIGDINALNVGDCYFIGQHMSLFKRMAPAKFRDYSG